MRTNMAANHLRRILTKASFIRMLCNFPVMLLPNLAKREVSALSKIDSNITVDDLIRSSTIAEHNKNADRYFIREEEESSLFRRPFQGEPDSRIRMAGMSYLLQHINIVKDCDVLDFGCGTGWFSRCLAYMGANVVGVDVSSNALRLGRKWLAQDPLAQQLRVKLLLTNGSDLPVEDASFDFITSFDAFHHVADQNATLVEMARVLRPGGIAVFHEPGPEHANTPDAQFEMHNFGVIENNIDVHAIWKNAQKCGFDQIWMSLPALQAPIVNIDQFDRVASGRPNYSDTRIVMQTVMNSNYNLRIFSLRKAV